LFLSPQYNRILLPHFMMGCIVWSLIMATLLHGSVLAQEAELLSQSSSLVMTESEFLAWWNKEHAVLAPLPQQDTSFREADQQPVINTNMMALSGEESPILEAGDVINIIVANNAEFTLDKLVIDPSGLTSLPLIGEVHLLHKSLSDLEGELTRRIAYYLVDPQVTVRLVKPHNKPVYVMGAVRNPGGYMMEDKDSNLPSDIRSAHSHHEESDYNLSVALSNAGGVASDADLEHVKIFNHRDGVYREVNLVNYLAYGQTTQDVILQPGQVVYVPRLTENNNLKMLKLFSSSNIGQHEYPIRIYGVVNKPDTYMISPQEMNLQAALAKAGVAHQANLNYVIISRALPSGALQKLVVNANTQDVPLAPNDLIIVPNVKASVKLTGILGLLFPVARTMNAGF
jgi:protein involved in polysaccharide export with SLBB domain